MCTRRGTSSGVELSYDPDLNSITQQQFSVHWEDLGSGVDSASFITLDGCTVPGQFLYGSGAAQRSGVRSSPNTERPFMFTQVHPSTLILTFE